MPLATTRRTGLVDQVIGQLREAISQGEWAIGERIPPESTLAETLGVGRNTVREAVRALAHSGLLEVRQGDGTYVRATSEVSGAIRRLCGSELREVLQVRRSLEVEGARLAATERTEEDLARLRELLAARDRAQDESSLEDFVRADAEFHAMVVRCGRNRLLTELYQGLTEVVTASVAATSHDRLTERVPIGHSGLVDAIADRDPARAAAEAGGFLDQLLLREESGSPHPTT
ncbi:DNA-binding FadR family transcriptional regulator [Amycolatopsis bartoniae]|uniref:GntR family transcriptional regulator n=1 Tax=Amycolatopsis bartoniae TaxID=941986 RepID=A0A8H9J1Z4_9PSEU|nr:FadR/GntR family transcriptional regulator [Amycolatopsis bartoniae]MBB2935903.1 DNA-binding FadR family transcriptional regulator [Amycolatopsis bartoniae]TVT02678.1 FadR family transcriptional regulator [Amycolatopsis bartoniae]GHF62709.1 GntR family transcriptional regulator [Amycolatopsis bartoniae]